MSGYNHHWTDNPTNTEITDANRKVTTANQILPEVIKKYKFVLSCKAEVMKVEQQLQMSVSTTNSFEEYVTLKQNLNEKITKFYQSIDDLEKTGVVIKSIEEGLLDFPAKRFDEEKDYSCTIHMRWFE